MPLFASLYLDEDVDVLVATLLRAKGFTVLTTVEAGRRTASDPDQLAHAVRLQHAILTHNRRDFEVLARRYLAEGRGHYGIIIAGRRPVQEVVRRLLIILDQFTADELRDQLLRI